MNPVIFTDSNYAKEGDLVQLQGTGHRSHLLVLRQVRFYKHTVALFAMMILSAPLGTRLDHIKKPFLSFATQSFRPHQRPKTRHANHVPQK